MPLRVRAGGAVPPSGEPPNPPSRRYLPGLSRGRPCSHPPPPPGPPSSFPLQKGDAIRALDDVLPDFRRDSFVADNAVDHRLDVALRQPVEGKRCDVGSPDPRWIEF